MNKLSERDKSILGSVIQEYIATGEPVGSRIVARRYMLNISPATVRNVMADLEDMGYLYQPHVSAGRIPTPEGFRLYLAEIAAFSKLNNATKSLITTHMQKASGDVTQLLKEASHLLSEISQNASVIILPKLDTFYFKRVDFVRLDSSRVLVVLISKTGMVYNHIVYGEDITSDDLTKYANYLNESYRGMTIFEMRDRLMEQMKGEKRLFDSVIGKATSLGVQALSCVGDVPDVVIEGKDSVYNNPGISDLGSLRDVVRAFEDKGQIVRMLNQVLDADLPGVKMMIGDEMNSLGVQDFSLIASGYGRGSQRVGSLGVIGPMRMDYGRVVPLVEYMAGVLSNLLEDV